MKNLTLKPILLSTEDASLLQKGATTGELMFPNVLAAGKPQHLYLVSDREIKEGNYVYHNEWNKIGKIISILETNEYSTYYKVDYGNKDFHEGQRSAGVKLKKIEFTTDPKLIAYGVPAIDESTEIKILDVSGSKREKWGFKDVNFLEEFCKRWNENDKIVCWNCGAEKKVLTGMCSKCGRFHIDQKDNQKVDVEKFIEDSCWMNTDGIKVIEVEDVKTLTKALQSQAGEFSLEDMIKCWNASEENVVMREHTQVSLTAEDYIQSLTKQPKAEIVIECEMEEVKYPNSLNSAKHPTSSWEIKLKDGQPILIFK